MPGKQQKPQNSIEETEGLARELRTLSDQVQHYADEMKKMGMPTFAYFKDTAVNKHLWELKMWLLQLQSEWGRQLLVFERSKRDAARLADGKPRRGRPRKDPAAPARR
jgi:hypothetical protein